MRKKINIIKTAIICLMVALTVLILIFAIGSTTRPKQNDTHKQEDNNKQNEENIIHYTEITSLTELVKGMQNGGNYKLATDITTTESVVIPEGVSVTLLMNGKSITGSIAKDAGAVLINNGYMIINGDDASVIKNDVADGTTTIQNKGTLVLNGGKYESAPWGGTKDAWPAYAINSAGSIVINDATVVGAHGAVAVYKGTGVINKGDFSITGCSSLPDHVLYAPDYEPSKLIIHDGNFTVTVDKTVGGDSLSYGNIVAYGGTFNESPVKDAAINEILAVGEIVDNDDGTWTVKGAEVKGQKELTTALKLSDNSLRLSGTFKNGEQYAVYPKLGLYADYYSNHAVSISGGNLALTDGAVCGLWLEDVSAVNDMTIEGDNKVAVLYVQENMKATTITNVNVDSSVGVGIYSEYCINGLELNNCVVNQDAHDTDFGTEMWHNSAFFATEGSIVTINGGVYKSEDGYAVLTGGTTKSIITINGGEFKGIISTQGDDEIIINAGTFENFKVEQTGAGLVIKGGTFDSDPSAYVAEGYTATNKSDNTWIVAKSEEFLE